MAAPIRLGDYVKEAWETIKPRWVAFILAGLLLMFASQCSFGLLAPILLHNLIAMSRDARREGKLPDLGALFNFDNFLNIFLAGVVPILPIILLSCLCTGVPQVLASVVHPTFFWLSLLGGVVVMAASLVWGGLMIWTMPLVVDKGMPWMAAIKTSMSYARGAIPGHLLLALVYGILFACCLPLTAPIAAGVLWVAYEDHAAGLAEAATAVEPDTTS